MDDIVRQAMTKWPNVPACYGWLALDARGVWRMRDERAQRLGEAGDPIRHPALIGFIARNYLHDEAGRWFFQNGPQQVFVDLALAPYIARLQPDDTMLLHTGAPMPSPIGAWMTEAGQLLLQADGLLAAVDDRDLAACVDRLRFDDGGIAGIDSDDALLAWLADDAATATVTLTLAGRALPVQRIARRDLPVRFGFDPQPRAADR